MGDETLPSHANLTVHCPLQLLPGWHCQQEAPETMLPLQNVPEGSMWKKGAQKSACGARHHWQDGSSLQWPAQKRGHEPQMRMNDYRELNLQLLQAAVSELLLMS